LVLLLSGGITACKMWGYAPLGTLWTTSLYPWLTLYGRIGDYARGIWWLVLFGGTSPCML